MIKLPYEIELFIKDLDSINYAVFKELDTIEESLYGEGDIDIVVNRQDIEKFELILNKYKAIKRESFDKEVVFYYLFIPSINKVVLIHVHTSLLIGSKIFKEILIPIQIETEYFKDTQVKVLKSEILLMIAIIRSVYRQTLKEEYNYLENLIKKSNEDEFFIYIQEHLKSLDGDIKFPINPESILKQNINLKSYVSYKRYIIVFFDILNHKIRKRLNLPVVFFKKGVEVKCSTNLSAFKRLEICHINNSLYSFIVKVFGGIVFVEDINDLVKPSNLWNKIYQGIIK